MFEDYKLCVLEDYRKKKAAGKLSLNLDLPTPASLKNECMKICNTRYLKKDGKFLREFFRPTTDINGYQKVIRRYDTDRFKPLCNFLRQKTNNTDEKNIELLAWLIDFPSRPYGTGWPSPDRENSFRTPESSRSAGEVSNDPAISGDSGLGDRRGSIDDKNDKEFQDKHNRTANTLRNRRNITVSLAFTFTCAIG